jgi:hypothetical protein
MSGIVSGMALVKPRYALSALPKTMTAMASMDLIKKASSLSPYMQARYGNVAESILGMRREEFIHKLDKVNAIALYPLTYGDAFASYTIWNASYAQSIDKGRTHEQAIADADSNVRLTQSDSMTASRAAAMKSQWARILTPFISYLMSMQTIVRGQLLIGDKVSAAQTAMMYIIFAPMVESMFKELRDSALAGDDDDDMDDKFWERVGKRWMNDAATTLGGSIVPALGIGSAAATSLLAGIDYASDAEADVYKRYQMSVPLIGYLDNVFRTLSYAPRLANSDLRAEAAEKMLIGTAGLAGTTAKKAAKMLVAGD